MIKTAIEALDFLSQLGREKVIAYLAESKTISVIVDDLLEYQLLTPAIGKGTIAAAYADLTRSIQADGDSILSVLLKLRDTVGGYLEVDNNGDLNWLETIGEDKGQQIRYKKNLIGIERDIDYSSLVNRLYAYGAGEGEARIKLSDADGQEEDYIEDTDSQTEWGGIYVGVEVDRSITSPETLLAWAQLRLAELKNPPISYRVDSVDLSKQIDIDFSFDALQLGSTVVVIDEDLGINVTVKVVRIEHPDLGEPQGMILELATRTKDITDTLAEVYDIQQLEQHIATKIGPGQVIIGGAVTIKDWLTEGETTIKGDVIRTGIIQSENWPTSGAWLDLTNGLMKLGPSADPFLYWDGATLHLKGDFEVEGYIEVGGAAADVNAGVTTIAGGKITANTITATQLSTGEIITVSAQIKNAIITDAKIISLAASKLTAESITVAITTGAGGKFRSSTSTTRVEIVPGGLAAYNAGTQRVAINSDGSGWLGASSGAISWTNAGVLSVAAAKISGELTAATIAVGKLLEGTIGVAITLSGSIAVTGSISAVAGAVVLNSTGLTITGEYLKFDLAGTTRGKIYVAGSYLIITSMVNWGVQLSAHQDMILTAGVGITLNTPYVDLPRYTSDPDAWGGRMYYNTTTTKLRIYAEGAWRSFQLA